MNHEAMLSVALAQLRRYRVAFLQIAEAAGEDVSDITDPNQLTYPDVADYAMGAVKLLKADYDECLAEPRTFSNHPCVCGRVAGNASLATGTSPTSTDRTASRVSVSADTPSLSRGTPRPYIDIYADLDLMLSGRGDEVDDTPMLRLASQAIEYELADRMMDVLDGPKN